jgi:methyl-accepting chemotaxis protein
MRPPFRRRNFFIKKELQGRMIFKFFLLSLLGVLFFAFIFSLLSQDNLTITYDGQQLLIGKTPMVLFKDILTANWVFLVIVGATVTLVSMILTHRVAGPLFRFEKVFEGMVQRDLDQKIVLRLKDEAKDTAELINDFTSMLSGDIATLQLYNSNLGDYLKRLQEGGDDQSDLLRLASDENLKINQLLGEYRLRSG